MRFVADVWAVAQLGLGMDSIKIVELADKSQDLYRKAGLNTASTGKMSTKQAVRKLLAGVQRVYDEATGEDMVPFIFAYRKADNTLAVYFEEDFMHFSTADFLDEKRNIRILLWNYNMKQMAKVRDAMVEGLIKEEKTELKTQTESAQTTETMQGQDPMQMLTQALAMMSQGGASVDESQVEAIVERKLKAIKPLKVEVVSATATKRVEKAHKEFANAIAILGLGNNIALVGEAGSGKSHGAVDMARALDLDYVVESCHGKMQSFDLVGAISPTTGEYISTKLRDAYENGKVLILDEFDRSNTETTIALNGILAGDCYGFPDGMVTKHKDFKVIACQNTFGVGTSKVYASAKAMDGSTRTRFVPIEWNIDPKLELAICGDTEATRAVQAIRKNAKDNGYDQILITPRQAITANQMIDTLGWNLKKAIQFTCLNGLAGDVQKRLLNGVEL